MVFGSYFGNSLENMNFGKIRYFQQILKTNSKCILFLIQLIVFVFWVMGWDYIGCGRVPRLLLKTVSAPSICTLYSTNKLS